MLQHVLTSQFRRLEIVTKQDYSLLNDINHSKFILQTRNKDFLIVSSLLKPFVYSWFQNQKDIPISFLSPH